MVVALLTSVHARMLPLIYMQRARTHTHTSQDLDTYKALLLLEHRAMPFEEAAKPSAHQVSLPSSKSNWSQLSPYASPVLCRRLWSESGV